MPVVSLRRVIPFPFEASSLMSRSWKRIPSDLADELTDEDGSDPKEFHAKPWDAPPKIGRKCLQLCEQVKDVLQCTLPACADPILQMLIAVNVEPAPNAGRLRVRVTADWNAVNVHQAQASLLRAYALLRTEMARAINRRRAPELSFVIV